MTYPKKQAEAQMIFRKTGGFVQGNMTLRDYFAIHAFQTRLAKYNDWTLDELTNQSYRDADAMLKERIK